MAIGRRILRVEDRPLLTGGARFVDDIDLEGALEAAFVRSPVAHGKLLEPGIGDLTGVEGV
jgi:aerobic carbon-monoxide dehydrogenase large subunit